MCKENLIVSLQVCPYLVKNIQNLENIVGLGNWLAPHSCKKHLATETRYRYRDDTLIRECWSPRIVEVEWTLVKAGK